MSQIKFDIADLLISNRPVVVSDLRPEFESLTNSKPWFELHDLGLQFDDAFADFIEYKLRWYVVDNLEKSFEEVASVLDKSFVVDLFGEEFLTAEYWEKK